MRNKLIIILFFNISLACSAFDAIFVKDSQIEISTELKGAFNHEPPKELVTIWDSIRAKADDFKQGLSAQTDLATIPKDFLTFYKSFISDSLGQKNKIASEEFIGMLGECDSTIRYNAQNWEYTSWNFLEFFPNNNHVDDIDGWRNYFYTSATTFYYEFYLKEIGMIYRVGFEKIESQWRLTLYYVNAC